MRTSLLSWEEQGALRESKRIAEAQVHVHQPEESTRRLTDDGTEYVIRGRSEALGPPTSEHTYHIETPCEREPNGEHFYGNHGSRTTVNNADGSRDVTFRTWEV